MSDKPSILFMNRVYPDVSGATGRLLKDLAEAYAYEGWDVTVISSGVIAGETQVNGVRIIRVKASDNPRKALSYMVIWARMLFAALRLKHHDILVTLSDPPMVVVVGNIVAKLKKSRHVNWCHDLYPDIVPALGIKMPAFLLKHLRLLRIKAMKSCDKIITCGRCMKKYLTHDGIDLRKISVVANWYDLGLDNCHDVPQKSEKPFQILYAGNIGLAHPIEVVLKAAKILDERGSDVEFLFVGSGERFDYIAQRRGSMGIDNIRLLPYQPISRLCNVMTGGDVHLVTMSEAASGLAVPSKAYSAIAAARPCIFIGSDNCEIAKVINEFGAGLVVEQDDVQGLVDAVLYFRKSSDAWQDAHKGATRAREVFNPKISIDEWMKQAQN